MYGCCLTFCLFSQAVLSDYEEVVVTGTFSGEPLEKLTSSLTVLDSELIKNLNKSSLADVLRTVPGVLVEEQGGAGGLVSVSLRGGESNFTVVMIDGVQLNDPTNTRGGSFDFGNLSLDSVERIEVVRGTQSAIYGSDALSGVINIITTQPRPGHQQHLTVEGGESGFWRASALFAGELETLDYKLQVGSRDSGDPISGSEQRSDEANLGLNWQVTDQHKLRLQLRYADGDRNSYPEQSGGPEFAVSDELSRSDYTDQSLSISWSYQLSPNWQSVVIGSGYKREETAVSPGIFPYTNVPPNFADTHFERSNIRWINRIGNQQYWLNAGVDRRNEKGRSNGLVDFGVLIPTEFQLDRTTDGVFVDFNAQVTSETLFQTSIRRDDPDSTGAEDSYKLGLRQDVSDNFVLMANWGQAFKLPSFFALGHSLTGNPDLVPETAEGWDVGGELQWREQLVRVTYFDNTFKELITFDEVNFKNINSGPVDSRGVEGVWVWQPEVLPISVQAEITYTDIDPEDKALLLTGRPEWKGGLGAHWQISPTVGVNADYRYTGGQYAGSQHTGTGTTKKLDNYQVLDFALAWAVTPVMIIKCALDNLLDEDYENAVGFPGLGRFFRAGVELSF